MSVAATDASIAYARQTPFTFSGDVVEDLLLGRPAPGLF